MLIRHHRHDTPGSRAAVDNLPGQDFNHRLLVAGMQVRDGLVRRSDEGFGQAVATVAVPLHQRGRNTAINTSQNTPCVPSPWDGPESGQSQPALYAESNQ